MGAHSYPHIVFATDATTLPREDLEALLHGLFEDAEPAPAVEHGPLQVILRLGDYAFTFWYDDDAEGLGQRYAEYAPSLKRRRVSRCTTMIDLSGEGDHDDSHADHARRLTESLAARSGVYVFSEDRKAFVGMDDTDPFAEAPAAAATPPASPVLEAPTPETEVGAAPRAAETPAAPVTEPEPAPEPVPAAGEPESQELEPTAAEEPIEEPAPETAPTEEPDRTRPEEPAQTGFFKRLFGRGKR